jgi:hypothetical protein
VFPEAFNKNYYALNIYKMLARVLQTACTFMIIDGKRRFGVTKYLIQQTAQSEINNHLSFISLLHVSTPTSSSSGKYIQRHISIENSVKICLSIVKTNYKGEGAP